MRNWFIIAAFMLAFYVNNACCADDGVGSNNRWAIVAADDHARAVADLFTVELSSHSDLELVERDQINRVLGELELKANGLVATDSTARFGKLSQANALVLITHDQTAAEQRKIVRIRLIDTRSSVRLVDTYFPVSRIDQDAATIAQELLEKRATLQIPTAELRLISISPIMSGEPGYELRSFSNTLTRLVACELHRHPNVVVLERAELGRLRDEGDVSGIDLSFLGAARLLETSLRRTQDNSGIISTCRIASPSDGKSKSIEVRTSSRELVDVRNDIVAAVLKSLGKHLVLKLASPDAEASEYDRRSRQFSHSYRPVEALDLAMSAYALSPTYQRLDHAIQQSHALEFFHQGKRNGLGMLLAAHQENLLRLEKAVKHPTRCFPTFAPKSPAPPSRQYQKSLTATNAKESVLLDEINSLRRRFLDERLRQTTDLRLQAYLMLQRIDLEIHLTHQRRSSIASVMNWMHRMSAKLAEAEIRSSFDDAYFRGLAWRSIDVIDSVNRARRDGNAGESSPWSVDDFTQWIAELSKLDARIARAADLLARLDQPSPECEQVATKLLDELRTWRTGVLQIEPADRVFRRAALLKVREEYAKQYCTSLLVKAEANKQCSELLDHSHSAVAFTRGLSKSESQDLALRVIDLIGELPATENRYAQLRIRNALGPLLVKQVPHVQTGFSLSDAPGAWQQYQARPIKLDVVRDARLIEIYVDTRLDAIERGGQLVLAVQRSQRGLSIERISMVGGSPRKIGPDFPGSKPGFRDLPITVSNDAIYVAPDKVGFTKLTRGSAKRFTENEGAASNEVFSFAILNGRLYIGYKDAFGTFDPATEQFDLLASSTAAVSKNPMDGQGSFFFWHMIPDQASRCLWLGVQHNGAGNRHCGLWKFSPHNNAYQHLTKAIVELSPADGGILVNKSIEPSVALLDTKAGKLTAMPLHSIASTSASHLARPVPHDLIKVGDHVIGSTGTLTTADGQSHQIPGSHRWEFLQRLGSGFITHYDQPSKTIWYIEPKNTHHPINQ